ncbi:hypothetical protein [Natrinema sp. CBA1119]|uniref:DUF7344 domain-containing protein n=1 Tax=Natrinema sp. CBA1119 TaxID=1608465 RepID=UPI001C3F4A5B|nr:hypothetical protein [Natrinema sp. CBA1119]
MSLEDVFQAVSNSRRRRVILSVDRVENGVDANQLSIEIASRENAIDPSKMTGEQRSRVYVNLVQDHLITLDELNVARYDPRSKLVKATDTTAPLARLIREVTADCYTPVEDAGE